MFVPFFRKLNLSEPVFEVYNTIVAHSRQEKPYLDWSIADTLTGRFDMISLHAALVFRRLRSKDEVTKGFSQNLFDAFFADMDRSLREMGVGDLSVGKRIEKMGSLFYGLLSTLTLALDSGDLAELEQFVQRNFHDGIDRPEKTEVANYIIACDRALSAQSVEDILSGKLNFGVIE